MSIRPQTPMRYCLTRRTESDRSKFVGVKCGKCVERFGVPRKSTFNNHGSLQHKASICKNEGFVK